MLLNTLNPDNPLEKLSEPSVDDERMTPEQLELERHTGSEELHQGWNLGRSRAMMHEQVGEQVLLNEFHFKTTLAVVQTLFYFVSQPRTTQTSSPTLPSSLSSVALSQHMSEKSIHEDKF